jgi:hypothetical protein
MPWYQATILVSVSLAALLPLIRTHRRHSPVQVLCFKYLHCRGSTYLLRLPPEYINSSYIAITHHAISTTITSGVHVPCGEVLSCCVHLFTSTEVWVPSVKENAGMMQSLGSW